MRIGSHVSASVRIPPHASASVRMRSHAFASVVGAFLCQRAFAASVAACVRLFALAILRSMFSRNVGNKYR